MSGICWRRYAWESREVSELKGQEANRHGAQRGFTSAGMRVGLGDSSGWRGSPDQAGGWVCACERVSVSKLRRRTQSPLAPTGPCRREGDGPSGLCGLRHRARKNELASITSGMWWGSLLLYQHLAHTSHCLRGPAATSWEPPWHSACDTTFPSDSAGIYLFTWRIGTNFTVNVIKA